LFSQSIERATSYWVFRTSTFAPAATVEHVGVKIERLAREAGTGPPASAHFVSGIVTTVTASDEQNSICRPGQLLAC
jgi:hypothetical protein